MNKLSLPQLQAFDVILKHCFKTVENDTYFQPVIKIDEKFLSCDFFLYNEFLRPLELEIDSDGDIYKNPISNNDYLKNFSKSINISSFKNSHKGPSLIFDIILDFVKNQNSFKCSSNFAYNITFLESNINLPIYRLDPQSTYEIVSIVDTKPSES